MRGREEVREYWMRQFETTDPHVEPLAFSEDEQGRMVVGVHQAVQHVYTVSGGLIARMDIRQSGTRNRQRRLARDPT